jgi:hypothetical protein
VGSVLNTKRLLMALQHLTAWARIQESHNLKALKESQMDSSNSQNCQQIRMVHRGKDLLKQLELANEEGRQRSLVEGNLSLLSETTASLDPTGTIILPKQMKNNMTMSMMVLSIPKLGISRQTLIECLTSKI